MPELPDLEVFAENLSKHFKGKILKRVEVKVQKKLNVAENELKTALEGHPLERVSRQGKTLQLHFGKDKTLGLHLMLHGEIKLIEKDKETKFPILEFYFDGDDGFALADFQKQVTPTLNPTHSEVPDAIDKDMSLVYLKNILSKRRTQIKQVLLDQKLIRGIGNAYADEILWAAGISPFSISKAIPEDRVEALHKAINEVLRDAIKQIKKAQPDHLSGELRDFLKIHNPHAQKSPGGSEIIVEKKGSRKTYYTNEQKLFK